MNNNTCNICKIEFKYPSLLKRHTEKKKGCINSIIDNTISNVNKEYINNNANIEEKIYTDTDTDTSIDTQKINNIKDIIKKNLCYKDILLLFSSIIDEKQNKINNISNDDINKDDINNIKLYNCKKCNLNFASGSSLCNHNKLGRCKGIYENIKEQENIILESKKKSETSFNDILGITINDSDNFNITTNDNSITNNNNITNNITNIITINAFGCESLDNITTKQFTSIFKNFNQLHKMLYELGNMIYKNNNMNFTKNNMNKNIVTYLSRDMEVKHISEREFIKDFESNIKKLCIELFHIHKNNISLDDLIEYMKSFLLFFDMLQENKINRIEIKEQLKSIMDYVFRDENINDVIKKINIELQNNEYKVQRLNNNIPRVTDEKIRLNEYYVLPNKDNKDKKHLCKIKDISLESNIEYKKEKFLEHQSTKKYNKKLESLEKNKEEIKTDIVVKFDSETGLIIDDRE